MLHTVESLKEIFNKTYADALKDPHIGSEIKPLFNEDGTFDRSNWNSCQDVIRKYLNIINVLCTGSRFCQCNYRKIDEANDINTIDYIHAYIDMSEDQWYIMINIINDDEDRYDSVIISWYKSRGRTDMISKNGCPITIEEYVNLLNELENAGFFNKENWK